MERGVKTPWVVGSKLHGRGQNTMDRGVDIPWVGGFKIPWVDIPWIGGSKYHG